MKFKFGYKKELKQNHFIGFTSFNHYDGETLFSDVVIDPTRNFTETENYESFPVPKGVEEKGRNQGFYPASTVAYFRILWKDFEPQKDVYNFQFVDSILDGARKNGQTVMLRFMPHCTTSNEDVPDWLKSIIDCPLRPDGVREKASPKDDRFLIYFAQAVKVFAEKYDADKTLNVMDISLSGAWGEGSGFDVYSESAINTLISAYTDNFKNTALIGQIASPAIIKRVKEFRPIGWRADGVGKPVMFENYYAQKCPLIPSDAWETAPVSFESYWWLGEWRRQGWDIDFIIDWTLSHHVSTFNGKNFPIPYEWKDNIDRWLCSMGYHFVIDECEVLTEKVENGNLKFNLKINNVGVAPIYNKIPLVVKVQTKDFNYEIDSGIDITTWLPGKHENEISVKLPKDAPCGKYEIKVAICDKDFDIYFASDAKFDGKYYTVGEFTSAQ